MLSLAGDLGLLIEGAQHITVGRNGKRLTALIAMANAALPADDPRKLTRAHVDTLRAVVDSNDGKRRPRGAARPTGERDRGIPAAVEGGRVDGWTGGRVDGQDDTGEKGFPSDAFLARIALRHLCPSFFALRYFRYVIFALRY